MLSRTPRHLRGYRNLHHVIGKRLIGHARRDAIEKGAYDACKPGEAIERRGCPEVVPRRDTVGKMSVVFGTKAYQDERRKSQWTNKAAMNIPLALYRRELRRK